MRPGQRPPKAASELVLQLAALRPRPTNPDISSAVRASFGVSLSDDTIRGSCQKAGLPKSTSGQARGASDVAYRRRHQDDLCALAWDLRAHNFVPHPELLAGSDSVRCLAGWRSDFGGQWFLPVEKSDLYDALTDHLDDSQIWRQMEHVRGSLEIYHRACLESLSSLLKMASSARYAGLPVASIAEPNPPSITQWFGESVYYESAWIATGKKNRFQSRYTRESINADTQSLSLNSAEIGYGRQNRELDHLELTHRKLREDWSRIGLRGIHINYYKKLKSAADQLSERLNPHAIRQRVSQGSCRRCP